MTYLLIFLLVLMLLCGCVDEVLLVVGISAGLCGVYLVYHFIRWSYDPAYRKRKEKEFEQIRREKYARRKPRGGPSRRQYENYLRTGNRNYLCNKNYRE